MRARLGARPRRLTGGETEARRRAVASPGDAPGPVGERPPPSGHAGLRPRIGGRRMGGGVLAALLAQKLLACLRLPLPRRFHPRPRAVPAVRVRRRGTEAEPGPWHRGLGDPGLTWAEVAGLASRGAGWGFWLRVGLDLREASLRMSAPISADLAPGPL